jgi:ketosteroid isomerase-like protein
MAMSRENLEAVRRANQAFADGDLDAALELWHPDAVYYEQPGTPLDTGEVLRGVEQIRASVEAYMDEFPDFHSEIDELIDVGEHVVCVQRWVGTGRTSGLEIDLQEILVLSFDDGKVVEARVHADRRSALAAAGVE